MGGDSSQQQHPQHGQTNPRAQNSQSSKPSASNPALMLMLGSTIKGNLIMTLTASGLSTLNCSINFPKYCNAILRDPNLGIITGGVQDLQANKSSKATIDFQIFEGTVSKKFMIVNLEQNKLQQDPEQAFKDMPDMINARYAHCSIEMNGRLYVMGGRQYGDDENGLLSACQAFDFKQDKWVSLPPLQNARSGAAVILFHDLIYIFGGYTGNNLRSRVIESYKQGDQGWHEVSNMHEGLQGLAIIRNPQKLQSFYLFGGKSNTSKSNHVVQLNFFKETISHHSQLLQQRSYHKIAQHQGKVYMIGGGAQSIEVYSLDNDHSTINKEISFLEYCTAKQMNAFSAFQQQIHLHSKKAIPEPISFLQKVYVFGHAHQPFTKVINCDNLMVVSQDQSIHHYFYQYTNTIKVNKENAFIMGGINSDHTDVTNVVYNFSLVNEEIKYLESMQVARYGFAAIVKGSFLYVFGGRKLGSDDVAILSHCERYSFKTYKWETIAPLKNKRHSSFAVIAGEMVIVIGGYKGNGVRSNDMEIYIESQNRWVELDQQFDLIVQAMTSVRYNNSYYLFGGRNDQSEIQKVFRMKLDYKQQLKFEKCVKVSLQTLGDLSCEGSNLKVHVTAEGMAYVFGNSESGIDVYDLNKKKLVGRQEVQVFGKLKDARLGCYSVVS